MIAALAQLAWSAHSSYARCHLSTLRHRAAHRCLRQWSGMYRSRKEVGHGTTLVA